MTEFMSNKAVDVIENNLEYLDEVVEAAIVNLMEDEGVEGIDNDFIAELQKIFEEYAAGAKYGKQIVLFGEDFSRRLRTNT